MPCDICNHTVQNIGAEGQRIFWCPRCGSLKSGSEDFMTTQAPILVRRSRDVIDHVGKKSDFGKIVVVDIPTEDWIALREAIGRDPHGA